MYNTRRIRIAFSYTAVEFHLPKPLFHALIACLASSVVLAGTSFSDSAESVTYTTHQDEPLNLSEYSAVTFGNIEHEHNGAVIYHSSYATNLSLNNSILFRGNATAYGDYDELNEDVVICVGLIYNHGDRYNKVIFTMVDNGDVDFSGNSAADYAENFYHTCGGAINNDFYATFTLNFS